MENDPFQYNASFTLLAKCAASNELSKSRHGSDTLFRSINLDLIVIRCNDESCMEFVCK